MLRLQTRFLFWESFQASGGRVLAFSVGTQRELPGTISPGRCGPVSFSSARTRHTETPLTTRALDTKPREAIAGFLLTANLPEVRGKVKWLRR